MRNISIMVRKSGLALVAFTILMVAAVAIADDDSKFRVVPFVFDPFHTDLVAADWVEGAGCPTGAKINTTGGASTTFTDPACPDGDLKDKENAGLLLVKTGPTPNIAAAGARIKGVKGITLTELGYDIRTGSHCGGGAPRFNITTTTGKLYFLGCNSPAPTTMIPSSTGWKRLPWGTVAPGSVMAFLNGNTLE